MMAKAGLLLLWVVVLGLLRAARGSADGGELLVTLDDVTGLGDVATGLLGDEGLSAGALLVEEGEGTGMGLLSLHGGFTASSGMVYGARKVDDLALKIDATLDSALAFSGEKKLGWITYRKAGSSAVDKKNKVAGSLLPNCNVKGNYHVYTCDIKDASGQTCGCEAGELATLKYNFEVEFDKALKESDQILCHQKFLEQTRVIRKAALSAFSEALTETFEVKKCGIVAKQKDYKRLGTPAVTTGKNTCARPIVSVGELGEGASSSSPGLIVNGTAATPDEWNLQHNVAVAPEGYRLVKRGKLTDGVVNKCRVLGQYSIFACDKKDTNLRLCGCDEGWVKSKFLMTVESEAQQYSASEQERCLAEYATVTANLAKASLRDYMNVTHSKLSAGCGVQAPTGVAKTMLDDIRKDALDAAGITGPQKNTNGATPPKTDKDAKGIKSLRPAPTGDELANLVKREDNKWKAAQAAAKSSKEANQIFQAEQIMASMGKSVKVHTERPTRENPNPTQYISHVSDDGVTDKTPSPADGSDLNVKPGPP